jgi:hypothetical protein
MSRDYMNIGSTPPDETCAAVGSDNYESASRRESAVYIRQLRRTLGDEPEGARLASKSFPHDFGSYREVVCYFSDEASLEYALKCESEGPLKWDEIAKSELAPPAQVSARLPKAAT